MPAMYPDRPWFKALGNTSELATKLGVTSQQVYAIGNGQRAISMDVALKLEEFFGLDAMKIMHDQLEYEVKLARLRRDG